MFLPNLDKMKTVERVQIAMFIVVYAHELATFVEGENLEEKACNLAKLPIESKISQWLYDAVAALDVIKATTFHRKGRVDIEALFDDNTMQTQ